MLILAKTYKNFEIKILRIKHENHMGIIPEHFALIQELIMIILFRLENEFLNFL